MRVVVVCLSAVVEVLPVGFGKIVALRMMGVGICGRTQVSNWLADAVRKIRSRTLCTRRCCHVGCEITGIVGSNLYAMWNAKWRIVISLSTGNHISRRY
jgi:hypothetical protein